MNQMKHPLSLSIIALPLALCFSGCGEKTATTAAPEPVAAKTEHETNLVVLTKENLAHVSIKTETLARGDLSMTLRAVGRLGENLNRTAKVTSTLEGRLIKLNFEVNDRVKAGDVIGLVQTPELLGKLLELRAPLDGVIMERKSTVGELITKETEICTITDTGVLWVLAEIKEQDIGAIRTGQEALFTVLPYPNERFRGKIALLGNRVETESRTLEVRIETDNSDGRLKPGMFTDVEITTSAVKDALTVSDEALQTLDENPVVFVDVGDAKYEKRIVKLGRERHGRMQILEGAKEGEKVVTEGSFILKSELLKGELGEEG